MILSRRPCPAIAVGIGVLVTAVLLGCCAFSGHALGAGNRGVIADRITAARLEPGSAADRIVGRAITAMKAVRTVRSAGTWGAERAAFTGTCVTAGPSASLSFHSGRTSWQLILISKPVPKDWERYRRGAAPWGKWQRQATGPGDFNFPLLLPLACPHVSLRDWRLNNVALPFQVAGTELVSGKPTWHLTANVRSARTIVDWYVDKRTYRLLRRRFAQLTATGKIGYLEDVSYTGFNTALTVLPPKA